MSTDLVPFNQQEVALAVQSGLDESGLGETQIKPSKLIIVQGLTQDPMGARPGQILDQKNGNIYDEIVVVPLKRWNTRVMFPPGSEFGADPLCRSSDGVVPSPFALVKQSETCASCPMSKWGKDKKDKPACSATINLLVILKEFGLPRILQFSRTGLAPANRLLDNIKEHIIIARGQGTVLNLHDFYFTFTTEKAKGAAYYVPTFTKTFRVKNPGEFGPVFTEFVTRRKANLQEDAPSDAAVSEVVDGEVVTEA